MDIVGGYRLVRKLGEGDRAEVHLGHAGPGKPGDTERTAAIKIFRSATSADSIGIEIEALARSSSRHLLSLVDLAIAPDGHPSLVLPRLGAGSLARLVETRSAIEAGEVVTAIAPIAAAVAELHRVGVAHGRIRSSTVLIDPSGAPVLAGFGNARLIGPLPSSPGDHSLPPSQLEVIPQVLNDLAGVSELARGLLDRVDAGDHPREVAELLEWLRTTGRAAGPQGFAAQLSERLFDLAPAVPLRVSSFAGERGQIPQRAVPPNASRADDVAPPVLRQRLAGIHVPEWLVEAFGASIDAHPLAAVRARVIRALVPVRRPIWVAGVAGLVAVGMAIVVLSAGGASSTVPGNTPAHSPPAHDRSTTAGDQGSGDRVSGDRASDDPIVAAKALLAARESCLSQRSVICLDRVDQSGSAAMDADLALIRRLHDGEDPPGAMVPGPAELRLVQQLGASAIIALAVPGTDNAPPASLLLVRGEAGWLIRDLILG